MEKQETIDTRSMPDDVKLPGHWYTLGEQRAVIRKMREINGQFYNTMFVANMGGLCHAFVEFAGLQAKFIDLCQDALDNGVEFSHANTHSGVIWPMESHHAAYLGEKFNCIYGFAIGPNPELRRVFIETGLGPEPAGTTEPPGSARP